MPYITQERRKGLAEAIDEHVEGCRDAVEQNDCWQKDTWKEVVENDIYFILSLSEPRGLELGKEKIKIETPLPRVTKELRERLGRGEAIGGDLNFCVCRYLVGLTQIDVSPRYESKIQWIQERLESVKLRFGNLETGFGFSIPVSDWNKRCLGILQCVSLELYRRYAAPYEDDACAREGSGDIMD